MCNYTLYIQTKKISQHGATTKSEVKVSHMMRFSTGRLPSSASGITVFTNIWKQKWSA